MVSLLVALVFASAGQGFHTALLTGILPYERGIIDAGIARIDEETINRMVDNAGQPARTGFEVLGYGCPDF